MRMLINFFFIEGMIDRIKRENMCKKCSWLLQWVHQVEGEIQLQRDFSRDLTSLTWLFLWKNKLFAFTAQCSINNFLIFIQKLKELVSMLLIIFRTFLHSTQWNRKFSGKLNFLFLNIKFKFKQVFNLNWQSYYNFISLPLQLDSFVNFSVLKLIKKRKKKTLVEISTLYFTFFEYLNDI